MIFRFKVAFSRLDLATRFFGSRACDVIRMSY
jgi:hypothetical protein